MKLLRVIRSVHPRGGGPVEALKQVSAVLTQRGHQVEVASLDAPGAPGTNDFPLPLHALGTGRDGYGYAPGFAPWLRAHAGSFDAVIVHGVWQYHSFAAWRALHAARTPYFVYPHGMLDPWFKRTYPLKHWKKWLYWPWAEYRVLRDARAVLFTCAAERDLARESFWLYRCRERVVSYGTAAPAGDGAGQRAEFEAKFPATRDRRVLLFLGRVHVKKGVDLLLRAFAQLTDISQEPWHLVIAGPAEAALLTQLQALAEQLHLTQRVTWTGLLQGDLKWGALRVAEAFVLPSHQENFGVAVAEALACGVPVLISDQVNIWHEIEQDRAGLVAPDTQAGVSELLHRWQKLSANERGELRTRAAECFARRYEIHRVTDDLLQTLRESGVNA